jgi:hypothetical protein
MSNSAATVFHMMKDAGVVMPDDVCRIVIDIKDNEIVKAYYETNTSKNMIDVVIESMVSDKEGFKMIEVK